MRRWIQNYITRIMTTRPSLRGVTVFRLPWENFYGTIQELVSLVHACKNRKGLELSWFVVLAAKNDFIHKISTLDQQEEAQPEVTSCLLLRALWHFLFFCVCQTSLSNCRTRQCWFPYCITCVSSQTFPELWPTFLSCLKTDRAAPTWGLSLHKIFSFSLPFIFGDPF